MKQLSQPLFNLLFAAIAALIIQSCSDNSTDPPANNPPAAPTLVEPADGAAAAPTAITLVWQATDPDNDSLSYDLYFDVVNPPVALLAGGISSSTHEVLHLSQTTTYFWKVIAVDRKGSHSTSSPVWQFTVGSFVDGWSELAPMPTSRFGAASAVVNGRLYVIGGNSYHGILNIVESYDPQTDTWIQLADMPSRRAYAAAVESDGIIYVLGGEASGQPQQFVEAYNPVLNSWMQLEPLPQARTRFAAEEANGKIYLFGGFEAPTSVLVYDIFLNQWEEAGELPQPRYNLSATAHNGMIYLIGGSEPDNLWLKGISVYDPSSGKVTARASMPTARAAHHASVIGDKIYVTGGFNVATGIHIYFASVEVYDILSDSWITRSRMEFARHDHAAGVIDNKIYVAGGVTDRLPDVLNSLEVYDPEQDQ